ncbi:PIN domain-containing protein [Nocardioides stalactiti]|uniref:PIN domain-containing protein n=1 Tax=Nocardioides stalactiti TaxID=2755356 RepID=UPI0015FFC523|nr:PIN domain-containing protein [Nocardioides stalactiti]
MSVVYDAGALIAADRADPMFWREHRARLERRILPIVPAPVVAQVSRAPHQAPLRLLLRGCEVVPLTEEAAHASGALLAASGTSDVVDAHVALTAIRRHALVLTTDPDDISRLVADEEDPPRVVGI